MATVDSEQRPLNLRVPVALASEIWRAAAITGLRPNALAGALLKQGLRNPPDWWPRVKDGE